MFVRLPRGRLGDANPGFDESFVVALNFLRQPFSAWFRADHGKDSRRSNLSALAGLRVFQLDLFELFSAKHLADLRLIKNLNVLLHLNPS